MAHMLCCLQAINSMISITDLISAQKKQHHIHVSACSQKTQIGGNNGIITPKISVSALTVHSKVTIACQLCKLYNISQLPEIYVCQVKYITFYSICCAYSRSVPRVEVKSLKGHAFEVSDSTLAQCL